MATATTTTHEPRTADGSSVGEAPENELSGLQWVSRFPGSSSLADLVEPFRSASKAFIKAIEAAGGSVRIEATFRPRERAYLMRYASMIANGQIAPDKVPAMSGVDIQWAHATLAASKSAASAMTFGYGIIYPPVLDSNHTRRTAIDMTISNIVGKTVVDATGVRVGISKLSALNAVGATFGVIKLVGDAPHWSIDGR